MKRFFCTVCKKYKRVRKFPRRIVNQHAQNPQHREGVCNWHTSLDSKKVSA